MWVSHEFGLRVGRGRFFGIGLTGGIGWRGFILFFWGEIDLTVTWEEGGVG